MSKDIRKPFKIHSSARIVMYTNIFIFGSTQIVIAQIFLFSRIFYKAILVSQLYRLPRCIVPYKHSLS